MKNNKTILKSNNAESFISSIKTTANIQTSLYVKLTNSIPLTISYLEVSYNLFKQKITAAFSHLSFSIFNELIYEKNSESYNIEYESYFLDGNILICESKDMFDIDSILIFYNHESDKDLLFQLKEIAISCIMKKITTGKIFLLVSDSGNLNLRDFELANNDLDISKHYNDDFITFHNKVIERLNKKNEKGILLLYGLSGAGKTTYIRHITKKVEKQFIYITPEIANIIASPDFLKFLMDYPNSILVIEDAEMLIGNRKNNSSPVITNLLNLSDGMLSDCLNIQIVCTFNMPLSSIDSAFLRKGRLIDLYYFDKLEQSKTRKLLFELGHGVVETQALTLAEIYNYSNENDLDYQSVSKQIGFKQSLNK
jgi:energy-coupling factor transporter ATP-binding protein EcfA2